MKRTFVAKRQNPRRGAVCLEAVKEIERRTCSGEDFEVEVREPRRTLDSNAAMWATLADIAAHVEWPHTVDGNWQIGQMDAESWKAVLTAAFEAETRMAQAVNGGTVMLGARTSKFSKRRMGEFLEFVHAFGAERGVRFSDKSLEDLAQWAPAERRHAA